MPGKNSKHSRVCFVNVFQVGARPSGLKPGFSEALNGTAEALPSPKQFLETLPSPKQFLNAL